MKTLSFLRALALAMSLLASPVMAAQSTIVGPITGPHTMADVMGTINGALLSIGSCNSGTSAPANGPGSAAFAGECWINTSANPWVFSYTADGTHWSEFGALNTSTFVWTGVSGGLIVNPTANTTNQGLVINQTAPSSGTPVGPILFNRIDVTNPGLGASGGGLDNFGGQNILYGLRATMSVTGASSGAGSAALGGFTNIRAASDGFGGALGVTITGTAPGGHNAWGNIGYGIVFNGGTIGLLVGLEGEAAVVAGATASIRVGVSSNSQGPVQGSVLDAAFAANTINIGAAGGNAAPWQHLMALSGNMYTGIGMPLAATGDFFFSDTAGTVAHFANLPNITVTGNILAFPNVTIAGNGGAVFGGGGTPTAGQLIDTCTSCGRSLTSTSINSTNGSDGTTYSDSSGNNVLFAGVGEAANNTVTRFGQATGNYGLLFTNSSTNLGLLLGTVANVPLIVGTNNTNRVEIFGSGCVSVGNTTDCGAPGIVNLLTGIRIGNAAATGNVLRGNGTNFVSAQLSCADLATPCITGNSTLTFGTHLTGTSYNGSSPITLATDATAANTASTIMARDGSGQVAATTFTGAVTGHASSDCALATCAMLGNISFTPDTAGIVGVTGTDSAATGVVGEYVIGNQATPQSLTTATPLTITSISLTAGDWDVTGVGTFSPAGTTNMTAIACSLSATNNTLDTTLGRLSSFQFGASGLVTGGGGLTLPCPTSRFSLASTTTINLVVQDNFSVSTMAATASIRARRLH